MFKVASLFLLVVTCASCIPLETTSSKAGLARPSPINPDVIGDPKPQESAEHPTPTASPNSHIQKIPARGVKLSTELNQDKPTSTDQPTLVKRQAQQTIPAKAGSNPAKTPTGVTKQFTTTTAEPVSLKTPIVHSSKSRRSADNSDEDSSSSSSNSSSFNTSTTRGPLVTSNYNSGSSSSNNDDNSGPHFVRPVPVDQILKNLRDSAPKHNPSPAIATHAPASSTTPASATSDDDRKTTVNDHKFHRKVTTTTAKPQSEEDSREDDQNSSEDRDEE